MLSELAERHLGFIDLWNNSWKIFKNQWTYIFFITLFFLVLPSPSEYLDKKSLPFIILVLVNQILFILLYIVPISILVENIVKGQPISYKQILRQSWSYLPGAIWTNILSAIIILFMLLLLIIPGIICLIYYFFVFEVVALRGLSGKAALDYSKKLVQGHWWKVCCFALVFVLVETVFTLVSSRVGFAHLYLINYLSAADIIIDTFSLLFSAFFNIFVTLLFLNLDYCRKNADSATKGEEISSQPEIPV